MADDPRTGLIALAAALDAVSGMPEAAKIADAGVAEIDRLRAALAAAEAERDRAMRACEQIGERIPAPGSSGWAAMKERAAIAIWNRNDDEIDADAALEWARGDAEVALLAALYPEEKEEGDA